jgi:hypothetical protein
MKFYLLTFIIALSLKAHATISNFQITRGTSNVFDIRINQDAWGVMAGPNFDPTGVISVDPTRTYDSCELPTGAAAPFQILPCHPDRVDGPTVISIRFDETSNFNGARPATAVFTPIATQTNPNPQPEELARSNSLFVSGQPITFEFTWADVCVVIFDGTMNADGQCQDSMGNLISGNVPVNIGVNDGSPCEFTTNPTIVSGVCDILPIPGDSGAFLETSLEGNPRQTRFLGSNLSYSNDFNGGQTVNLNYTGIRLYFFESSDPLTFFPFSGTARIVDLDISSPNPVNLDEDRISGLTNGVTYTVLASSIDESGTISQFLLPQTGANPGYCDNGFCPQITPSQVAGVIVDSSCFITTATYGSKYAYQVKTFQNFRETFLRGTYLGDKLIGLYNHYGPYAAVFLNNNSYLKPVVRVLLYPFYLFSKMSLSLGPINSLGVFFVLLISLVFALRWRPNR